MTSMSETMAYYSLFTTKVTLKVAEQMFFAGTTNLKQTQNQNKPRITKKNILNYKIFVTAYLQLKYLTIIKSLCFKFFQTQVI